MKWSYLQEILNGVRGVSYWREEKTLLGSSAVWRWFAGTPARTKIIWHRYCHLSTKLIFPGLYVYLMTSLVQHSIWQLHRRISSQWVSVNVGESKGGLVSWEWHGYPLPSEDLRQISASEENSVPWRPGQFVGKVLLSSESSGGGAGLCCLFFLTCESSQPYQGNDLLTPGIEAVGFAMPARVKFRQGGDVFF